MAEMDTQAAPIKHLKVFISYTGEDLSSHADVVIGVLRRMEWIAVDHRDWAPTGQPSVQACRDKVSECAVLVLLVAHRYGWVPKADEGGKDGKSITRLEYELARELDIPVVPFVATSEDGWPVELVERHKNPGSSEPLEAFKAEVRKHVAAFFAHDPNSIKDKIEIGLRAAAANIVRDAVSTGPRGEVRPTRLPYLCDRSPQSRLVRQRLQAQLENSAARPLLMLVHGNSDEAHLPFVKRVEGDVLPKYMPALSARSKSRFCHLQALEIASAPDFGAAFRIAISNKIQKPETSNDIELLASLRSLNVRGLFVVLQLCASECGRGAEKILQTVRDYWQAFPGLPPDLLVTCILCVKYDEKPGMFDRLIKVVSRTPPASSTRSAVEKLATELAKQPQSQICVLPELTSATRRDIEDLIADAQDVVRRHVSDADYHKWFGGRPSLPMDIAINHLEEVLDPPPRT